MVKPGDQSKPNILVYCPMTDTVWTAGIRLSEMPPNGVKVSARDAMRNVSRFIDYRWVTILPGWSMYSDD